MFQTSKLLKLAWQPLVSPVRRGSFSKELFDRLRLIPATNYTTLDNGMRIASQEVPGAQHMCIGLFIDAGSRYEWEFENGIANFFARIAYHSTMKRKAETLKLLMNGCGARFRCITSREMVVYYADCLSEDISLVLDILIDCVYNNAIDPHAVEEQKENLYNEMIAYENHATGVLFDYLHGAAFNGTPLSQTVMGKSGNLDNFCEKSIRTYLSKYFGPRRTVLAAYGGVRHEQLVCLAQCFKLQCESSKCDDNVYRFTAGDFRFRDDAWSYCSAAIAFEAPCICDDRRWVMDVASMHIGGWDCLQPGGYLPANEIAKASSFADHAYGFRSFYIKYKDTGLWGVHFLGNKLESDMIMYNIQNEFMNLCCTITENEVDRAKHALLSKLLRKFQSVTTSCFDLGKWTLYAGQRPPVHVQLSAVEEVSAAQVRSECDYFLYDRCPAVAAVGPCEGLPHYTRIRSGQYWLRI